MSMRITYVTHTRFPTEKAHGHQIAQVCAALGELGHTVTLVHPNVWTQIDERDPWGYYGVSRSFMAKKLPSLDALQIPIIRRFCAFPLAMWSYRRQLRKFLRNDASDLYYCRSWEVVGELLRTGTSVHMELHTLPRMWRRRFVSQCNRCTKIICLTSPMREEIVRLGVDPKRVIIESDGVDLVRFSHFPKAAQAKSELRLPADRWIVGYVGSLVTRNDLEKGVRELLHALSILKRSEGKCFGWIVGGPDKKTDEYKKIAASLGLADEDIRFEGQLSASSVPMAISACDLCVYPAPKDAASHPYFMRDTSPLKLFEYLAAGKPIVCADLPPLRDIVDETMVTFCKPGDPKSMTDAIAWVIAHPGDAEQKAKKGKERVKWFDWKERMKRILSNVPSPSAPFS